MIDENIWHDYWNDEVVYLLVTSNGKTGDEWIKYLNNQGVGMDPHTVGVEGVLQNLEPTNNNQIILAVYRSGSGEHISEIRAKAHKSGWVLANAEIACLVQDKYTSRNLYEAMGFLRLAIMHEPICGNANLLTLRPVCGSVANSYLGTTTVDTGVYASGVGFVFVVP